MPKLYGKWKDKNKPEKKVVEENLDNTFVKDKATEYGW